VSKRTILAITVALVLVAAGCQCAPRREVPTATPTILSQPTETPSPAESTAVPPTTAPSGPTSPPPLPTATSAPSTDYLGVKHQGGTLGAVWTLADIRVGAHEDRFRVVIEMRESRDYAPYHEVVEVDNEAAPFPTGHDPSWGAARIDVIVSDLYLYDFPVGERLPITGLKNPVVTRIGLYPTESDAHGGFSIGLSEPAPYEVYYLTEPVRIVIDVVYP
jgi:hypothetical protein